MSSIGHISHYTCITRLVFCDITTCRCELILSYFHVLEFTQTRKMVPKNVGNLPNGRRFPWPFITELQSKVTKFDSIFMTFLTPLCMQPTVLVAYLHKRVKFMTNVKSTADWNHAGSTTFFTVKMFQDRTNFQNVKLFRLHYFLFTQKSLDQSVHSQRGHRHHTVKYCYKPKPVTSHFTWWILHKLKSHRKSRERWQTVFKHAFQNM